MGVDAAERDCLMCVVDGSAELTGSEDAVVTMVVLHGDVMPVGKAFESGLGFKCVISTGGLLGVYVVKPRGMVNKNGCNKMSFILEFTCGLGYQPRSCGDELNNRDTISWF